METVTPFAAVFALAFLCESLTEYFFADPLARLGIKPAYLRYVAALVGVALALLYGLDALQTFLSLSPRIDHLGEVLTGLMLGRGANYVHDFYSKFVLAN